MSADTGTIGASSSNAASPAGSAGDPNAKNEMVGGDVIISPSVRRAMTVPDDHPQAIGARAPAPGPEVWVRAPFTTPQERFDAAEKARAPKPDDTSK